MIKMIKHRLLRTPAGSRISRPPQRSAMSIAAISAYPDKSNMGQAEAVNMWRRPFPARASQDRRRRRRRRQRIGRYWCTRITSALPQYGPSKNHPTVFTCGCSSSRLSPKTRYRRAGVPPLQRNLCEHAVSMLRKVKCSWRPSPWRLGQLVPFQMEMTLYLREWIAWRCLLSP